MEKLFTTTISKAGQSITYDVHFENERYLFVPNEGSGEFGIKREEDEWHPDSDLDNDVREAAIKALDEYLLSQH